MDISKHIIAKSDQLNADDLAGGEVIAQITGVRPGNSEQPVIIEITGGHQPWKPCKTALRQLAACWGSDAGRWVGRSVCLYRDASVMFGKMAVGGIRIRALSHIDAPVKLALNVSRGKKAVYTVEPLRIDLDALLDSASLTRADVDAWLAANGKPSLTEGGAAKEPALAAYLAGPGRLDAVRAARGGDHE